MPQRGYAKRRRYTSRGIVPARRRGYYRVRGRSAGALVTMPERKYFDSLRSSVAIAASTNWTGTEVDPTTLDTLFAPVQGSGIKNRIGRKVAVHKITIKGVLNFPVETAQTVVANALTTRLLLVMDKQSNGSQMQGEEVMQAPATATSALVIGSFQSLANFGRFRVLKDKVFLTGPGNSANNASATTVSNELETKYFKFKVAFRKPIIVHFNNSNGGAGDGDIGDIVDNSFHLLATTDIAGQTLSYNCRTVFTDA